jgi:hypothetical protein
MRNVAAQMGQGSIFQTAVARVAQTYHEASNKTVGGGACRCHEGSGPCSGCEVIPIYRTQSRMKGDDGPRGGTGNAIQDTLLRGTAGADGRAQIIVRHSNGDRPRYDRCYDLQLVDFDLEDENGDGIFEPGECAIVRRIVVKNAGKCIVRLPRNRMLTIIKVECHPPAVRFQVRSLCQTFFSRPRMMMVEHGSPLQYLGVALRPLKTMPESCLPLRPLTHGLE